MFKMFRAVSHSISLPINNVSPLPKSDPDKIRSAAALHSYWSDRFAADNIDKVDFAEREIKEEGFEEKYAIQKLKLNLAARKERLLV